MDAAQETLLPGERILETGGRRLHIVGTVRGLVREGDRVEALLRREAPDAIALGIAPEDLEGVARLAGGEAYEHEFSEADAYYEHYLGRFGEVALPPRELLVAHQYAEERGIPLLAVDLPEAEYVEVFTDQVGGLELLRYNRRVRRMARRPLDAPDALAFHLWWDAQICRLRGFAAVERAREVRMARRLRQDDVPRGRLMVLVEAARVEGLSRALAEPAETPRK